MPNSSIDCLFETSVGWFKTYGWIDHLRNFDPEALWYNLNFLELLSRNILISQSISPEMFYKKGVLWQATLLKRRPWKRYFPVIFSKFLKITFFKEHFRWLLLINAIHYIRKSKFSSFLKYFEVSFVLRLDTKNSVCSNNRNQWRKWSGNEQLHLFKRLRFCILFNLHLRPRWEWFSDI